MSILHKGTHKAPIASVVASKFYTRSTMQNTRVQKSEIRDRRSEVGDQRSVRLFLHWTLDVERWMLDVRLFIER